MYSYEIVENWTYLSEERKLQAWTKLLEKIDVLMERNGFEAMEEFIIMTIENADLLAQDEYFGAGGLKL